MKTLFALLTFSVCLSAGACGADVPGRYELALEKLAAAETNQQRFYALREAAKMSFAVGKIDSARQYATELSALSRQFGTDWNYGNAVHDANLVLGRIAVHDGDIERAKFHLLEAGKTPGSPQLNSFGPNVSLAKDLLEKGEREAVLTYLNLCRKFWVNERGRLARWAAEISSGRTPDFGPNLVY